MKKITILFSIGIFLVLVGAGLQTAPVELLDCIGRGVFVLGVYLTGLAMGYKKGGS